MVASSASAMSASAAAQASSEVSRAMTCRRMPKRSSRPASSARARDLVEVEGESRRRIAPGQSDVGVAGGHPQGRLRRAAEVDLGRLRHPQRHRPLGPQVLTVEVEGRTAPRAAQNREELVGPGVALVLAQAVAEAPLLLVVAPGDDVQRQPAAGVALERRRLLGCQRRRDRSRPERHQKAQPVHHLAEGSAGDPRVVAGRAGGGEGGVKARLLRGSRHLCQVGDGGLPAGPGAVGAAGLLEQLGRGAGLHQRAPVAVGG